MDTPAERGRRGEDIAVQMLTDRGLRVLARNWRDGRRGELDIVAHDPAAHALVFVEVKTRTTDAYGSPASAITPTKYRRLRQLAAAWLECHPQQAPHVRIDVVEVRLRAGNVPLVTHLQGV